MAKNGGKKGGQKGGLQGALASIEAMGKPMARERQGDYKLAQGALNIGAANLKAQLGAVRGEVLSRNASNSNALASLVKRARAEGHGMARQENGLANQYGTALGSSIAGQYGVAEAQAGAGLAQAKGARALGGSLAAISQGVANLAGQGAQAQAAAADQQLARAMQSRTMVDNNTMAQLEGKLLDTAMQYNMQFAMQKKMAIWTANQAKKAQNAAFANAAPGLAEEAGTMSQQAWDAYSTVYNDQKGNMKADGGKTITDLAGEYATSMNYAADSPQVALYSATLRAMWGKDPQTQGLPQDAIQSGLQSVYGGTQGWDQFGAGLQASASSSSAQVFYHYYMTPGGPGYSDPNAPQANPWSFGDTYKNIEMAGINLFGGGGQTFMPNEFYTPGTQPTGSSSSTAARAAATAATGGDVGKYWRGSAPK